MSKIPRQILRDFSVLLKALLMSVLLSTIFFFLHASTFAQQIEIVQDYKINLRMYSFDPLVSLQHPDIPQDLTQQSRLGEPSYQIIQFKRSLNHVQMELLKDQYGLKLNRYIPNYAYLERVSQAQIDSLTQFEFYRWSGLYHPAYKIATRIGEIEFRNPEDRAREGILIRAMLHLGANTASVVEQLTNIGASNIRILDDRKYKGTVRVRINIPSTNVLNDIAKIEDVFWIEEVAEIIEDNVNTSGTWQSGTPGTTSIWNQGIQGEGQIIGIIDSSPLDIGHCYFRDPVNNTPRPDHRKVLDIRNASGTTAQGHASFVAGNAAGNDFNNPGVANRRGGAWASRLVSGNNRDIRSGLTTMLAELYGAKAAGATIHSNSWHDNTAGSGNRATYNQTSADVDNFIWHNEDHLVFGSAGNVGEEQGPPGTAKNAICVGATLAFPNEMNFGDGNKGPTADGRLKPDLMTPGCGIRSATAGTACTTGPRANCATSYATPHTAAAAALIRQYYTEGWYPSGSKQSNNSFSPSGALIKATLLNSTIDMTGIVGYPNIWEGWGLIRLDNALYFSRDSRNVWVRDVRNINGLTTGESNNYTINVVSNALPLKATLVWTEPPASTGSANPNVNDLNLVVIDPNNNIFLGNSFVGGQSVTGGVADNRNNVEMVLINIPIVGEYAIQINGMEVNLGNPGQGYALVVTADTPDPPYRMFSMSAHGGYAIPRGSFANIFNSGVNFLLDVSYWFNQNWALVGFAGYNDFISVITGVDDNRVWNLSLNLRNYREIPTMPGNVWSYYLGGGLGVYIPDFGDTELGLNIGFGVNRVVSSRITAEVGVDYHKTFDTIEFIHNHVGVVYKF